MSMNSENRNAEGNYGACTSVRSDVGRSAAGRAARAGSGDAGRAFAGLRGMPRRAGRRCGEYALAGDRGACARSRCGIQPDRDGADSRATADERRQIHLAARGFGGVALCSFGGICAGAAGFVRFGAAQPVGSGSAHRWRKIACRKLCRSGHRCRRIAMTCY